VLPASGNAIISIGISALAERRRIEKAPCIGVKGHWEESATIGAYFRRRKLFILAMSMMHNELLVACLVFLFGLRRPSLVKMGTYLLLTFNSLGHKPG
jgi:hypothetical protein